MEYSSKVNSIPSREITSKTKAFNFSSNMKPSIRQRYLDFCDAQMKQRTVWFLIPLMSLSAAIMPAGFVLMWNFDWYTVYVAISVLTFFGNIILNIAEQNTRTTISFYFITVLFHIISIVVNWMIFMI